MSVFIRNEDGVVSRHPRNAWALTCLLVSLHIHRYYTDHTITRRKRQRNTTHDGTISVTLDSEARQRLGRRS